MPHRSGGIVLTLVGIKQITENAPFKKKKCLKGVSLFFYERVVWGTAFLQNLVGTNPNWPDIYRRPWHTTRLDRKHEERPGFLSDYAKMLTAFYVLGIGKCEWLWNSSCISILWHVMYEPTLKIEEGGKTLLKLNHFKKQQKLVLT